GGSVGERSEKITVACACVEECLLSPVFCSLCLIWVPAFLRCSAVRKGGTVSGSQLVDPPLEPRRNKGDHDGHEVDAALVPDDVRVVAVVHEARSGRNDLRGAGGIVGHVEG